jgi:hypothetical protein
LARFLPAPAAPQQAPTLSAGGKTELLMGKPNSISDFLQPIVAQPFPSKASIQKRAAGLFSATEVDFKS